MNATKPKFLTDEHLNYLDDLRESGETNMFGAARYLDAAFPELNSDHSARSHRSSPKAVAILSYWMETFEQRHSAQPPSLNIEL